MPKKPYKLTEAKPATVGEPAAAYQRTEPATEWNPNIPVHATQDEWWEHIRRIEAGHFSTWEEHQKKFEAWKEKFLANRMK
ncbi:hypothetical protein FACS189438_2470 [Bacteroidia bacterium]|nr:hypothetical protein FACS189438_2470 [Bacteroidia bacterium]